MATALWGRVYYQDAYAGLLQKEPNGRYVFTYDPAYLHSPSPCPISYTLPLREKAFIAESGLHPYFDNLVAEGWFQKAQARALQVDSTNRFALLLGFGYDLIGAVSIRDPEPREHISLAHADDVTTAALLGRASLSGIQRKLMVVKEGNKFRPAHGNELSTHIAKLASGNLQDIVELEYLTTLAIKKILPNDECVELEIGSIASINEPALIVKRFDRTSSDKGNIKRIHFEEFNQLLGHSSEKKYNGSYENMGNFIYTNPECAAIESERLYKRILACFLLGNTDAHFKNFAMFHTLDGLRLTPAYDLVAAARYKEYHTIALQVGGAVDLDIGMLKAKHLIEMGYGFGLNENAILGAVEDLKKHFSATLTAISKCEVAVPFLRNKLIDIMEKRWKGSFDSIGQLLLKRQSKGGKSKS